MRRGRARVGGCAAVALALGLVAAACSDDADARAEREAEVAERGAEVMPFDLEATTHVFTPTGDGGVQLVRADDPDDAEQIALVRDHLEEEAERFRAGDFGDPAAIHGHDMPGLAALEAGHERIAVDYAETPSGALVTYSTDDPALVEAIHDWFDAQLMDHGAHAEPGE